MEHSRGMETSSGERYSSSWLASIDFQQESRISNWFQTVQKLQQMTLTNLGINPAQTPNWDLVSSIVSANSFVYRSPRQCQLRFEFVILPREEGRLSSFDPIAKKIKFSQLTPNDMSKLYDRFSGKQKKSVHLVF